MRSYFLTMFFEGSKQYEIDIYNLKNEEYEFSFSFDDGLFQSFEYGLVSEGSGAVELLLVKTYAMITLDFSINGKIKLVCDRSLEEFDYPFEIVENIILKFGQSFEELDENMFIVPEGTLRINITQMMYELITAVVPMKKLHPRFQKEEDDYEALVYTDEEGKDTEDEDVDPRWEELRKIKNNLN